MKRVSFCLFTFVLLCCFQVKAQDVLLPFGQFTKQPWEGTYFYSVNGENMPPENWYAKDFDDSQWGKIQGPISTSSGIPFFVTPWGDNGTTYWVRRHFKASDVNDYLFKYLYIYHDDACEIYLNGFLIYSYDTWRTEQITVTMTDEMCSHFVEGDNVVAVKVSDLYGGQAFMDFGIVATNTIMLANSNFNNGYDGWLWSGDGYAHGGQEFNYVARFLTKNPFDVHQTVKSPQKGLFRLRTQAFESYNEDNLDSAWDAYGTEPVLSNLYMNDTKHKVNNIFDEALSTNIYRNDEYYITGNDTYVPTYMKSVSIAYQNGMYENEFYAYIDTTEFNLGIAMPEKVDMNKWVVFDNFRLEYIGEKALTDMANEIERLSNSPMEVGCKANLSILQSDMRAAGGYEQMSRVVSKYSDYYVNAKNSAEQYSLIKQSIDNLSNSLNTGSNISKACISETKYVIANLEKRMSEGSINALETRNILVQLENLAGRLNYLHLEVNVTVPGSLGDSILSKVDNFTDVMSLKVSGTLNDDDLTNIKSRLTQLKEIDMTDVSMSSLPNYFFYENSVIEVVKLPAQLVTIGEYAFYKCYGIRHIEFPSTLKTIKRYGFAECDNLLEVVLPEGFSSLEYAAFRSCDHNIHVKLPTSLKSISEEAFDYNLNLKTIDFSVGLTHIYNTAFRDCKMLNNLKFPSTLYYIGNSAFAYNSALSNIGFNECLYQIDDNAFCDCDALREVTLPSTLVLANESPFDYCDNLVKVTCLSIEPPYMTDQIPYGLGMEDRELYVPALSVNTYKQTAGWDKFKTIKSIDFLPNVISVLGDLKLTLTDADLSDYQPNVNIIHDKKRTSYWQYGSLTVNGEGTLSMKDFSMIWDPNIQYHYPDRNQNNTSLLNNSLLYAENVSISLWTHNYLWSFITMPFDVKLSEISTIADGTTNWVIRKYDGQKRADGETSETWVKLDSDDIMKAGEGYIIQGNRYNGNSSEDYSGFLFKAINNANKNNIFQSTNIEMPLKEYVGEFSHNRSWNLIGNPYPCYYDTRFMDFEAPITVWNMNNSTYSAYSPSDDSYILCPGEAFFVQRPIDKDKIVFDKDGRQTNRDVRTMEASARMETRASDAKLPRTILNLTLSDGNATDRTRIVLNEKATLQYEMDKDASKFMSDKSDIPQLFTSANGVNYAINERPLADGTVNLSAHIGIEGEYTMALINDIKEYEVILEDKSENKNVNLSKGNYTFSAEAGIYTDRFILHINKVSTGIESVQLNRNNNADIYTIEGIKLTTPSKKGIIIQNGKKILMNN